LEFKHFTQLQIQTTSTTELFSMKNYIKIQIKQKVTF